MENTDNLHDEGISKSFKCMWWDYFYREMSKWSEKKRREGGKGYKAWGFLVYNCTIMVGKKPIKRNATLFFLQFFVPLGPDSFVIGLG